MRKWICLSLISLCGCPTGVPSGIGNTTLAEARRECLVWSYSSEAEWEAAIIALRSLRDDGATSSEAIFFLTNECAPGDTGCFVCMTSVVDAIWR